MILKWVIVPLMVVSLVIIVGLVIRISKTSATPIESKRIVDLRKLFVSTSLSTALLSFFSTMTGLQQYIFQDNFIFAFVLSGAVQGALFAISTDFFAILGKFSRVLSKLFFIIIWFTLLLFSSGFSYVGISKTAYPDSTFKLNAEQVLLQYCLDTNYELLDCVKILEETYLEKIYQYINDLNGNDSGYTIAARDEEILKSQERKLEEYKEMSEGGDDISVDMAEIKGIFDTEMLCIYIKSILTGQYGNDLEAYKEALNNKIVSVDERKQEYDRLYDSENKLIYGDPNANSEEARLGYNGRSAQYHNLSDPNFLNLQKKIAVAEDNKKQYKKLSDTLNDFKNYLESCRQYITQDFETGAESDIYNNTMQLREEINKKDISTNTVIKISEEIYKRLIENNIEANDPKIANYAAFRNNIYGYESIIKQKKTLEEEIEILSTYDSEILTEQDPQNVVFTNDTNNPDKETKNKQDNDIWRGVWISHLFKIQSVLQYLPAENLSKEKIRYLDDMSERKRLYLTDINAFDKAWSLLFVEFHPIKYKIMLFVSVAIAFALDLISFAMGCLLSKIKSKI